MIFMKINLLKLNFGKLILMKIIEISAIRRHILKLKCIKFDFAEVRVSRARVNNRVRLITMWYNSTLAPVITKYPFLGTNNYVYNSCLTQVVTGNRTNPV